MKNFMYVILSVCFTCYFQAPKGLATESMSELVPIEELARLAQPDEWVATGVLTASDGTKLQDFYRFSFIERKWSTYELSKQPVAELNEIAIIGYLSSSLVKKRGIDSNCKLLEEIHTKVNGSKYEDTYHLFTTYQEIAPNLLDRAAVLHFVKKGDSLVGKLKFINGMMADDEVSEQTLSLVFRKAGSYKK